MVEQQPVLEQQGAQRQIQKHQSFSESRVALKTCKPITIKISRAEMMQEQIKLTRTLLTHMCIHAPMQTCTYMHANMCAQMHSQKSTYVLLGTCTRTFIHTYVCERLRT